jgi:L-iditol 2-dehydrogenase
MLSVPFPNPSLQTTPDHHLKLVEAPVYLPQHGEVLLHIKTTGICGSDLHFWKTGRIVSLVFEEDGILGHEASGVVLKCGEGVTKLKPGKTGVLLGKTSELGSADCAIPGDRVAVEPGVPCGECFLCMEGRYNLCEEVHFAGVYPYDGTAQRFKVHPAKWLHK